MSNEERIIKQAQTIQRKKMEKFAEKFIRKINEQIFISNNNDNKQSPLYVVDCEKEELPEILSILKKIN